MKIYVLTVIILHFYINYSDLNDLSDCNSLKAYSTSPVIHFSANKDTDEYILNCSQEFANIVTIQFDGYYSNLIKTTQLDPTLYPNLETIYYVNFGGIDLSNRFISSISIKLTLHFYYTKLDFYLNRKIVNNQCDDYNVFKDVVKFKDIDTLSFTNSDKFLTMCPYIFTNSYIKSISLREISNTFISKNFLQIIQLNNVSIDINSYIENIELKNVYSFKIDTSFLDKLVFKNTQTLFIHDCNYLTFADGLFESLRHLTRIQLRLNDYSNFFRDHIHGNF